MIVLRGLKWFRARSWHEKRKRKIACPTWLKFSGLCTHCNCYGEAVISKHWHKLQYLPNFVLFECERPNTSRTCSFILQGKLCLEYVGIKLQIVFDHIQPLFSLYFEPLLVVLVADLMYPHFQQPDMRTYFHKSYFLTATKLMQIVFKHPLTYSFPE